MPYLVSWLEDCYDVFELRVNKNVSANGKRNRNHGEKKGAISKGKRTHCRRIRKEKPLS